MAEGTNPHKLSSCLQSRAVVLKKNLPRPLLPHLVDVIPQSLGAQVSLLSPHHPQAHAIIYPEGYVACLWVLLKVG